MRECGTRMAAELLGVDVKVIRNLRRGGALPKSGPIQLARLLFLIEEYQADMVRKWDARAKHIAMLLFRKVGEE